MDRYSERAVLIGPRSALVGIITQAAKVDPNLPAIVVLNSGTLPRCGQSRIYVSLSRRLAPMGYRILRFDLSGIGDSPTRGDGLPPIASAIEDISEALDWFIGESGRVILIGLCDGANLAAHRASIDPRVVGVFLGDPLVPRTSRYRRKYLVRRFMSAWTWRKFLHGKHPIFQRLPRKVKALIWRQEEPARFDPNDAGIRAALSAVYDGMTENEVEIFALFTHGAQHRHCYREQILDAFPRLKSNRRLQLEYLPAEDHHLEWPPHRAWFLEKLVHWITATPFRSDGSARPKTPSVATAVHAGSPPNTRLPESKAIL